MPFPLQSVSVLSCDFDRIKAPYVQHAPKIIVITIFIAVLARVQNPIVVAVAIARISDLVFVGA